MYRISVNHKSNFLSVHFPPPFQTACLFLWARLPRLLVLYIYLCACTCIHTWCYSNFPTTINWVNSPLCAKHSDIFTTITIFFCFQVHFVTANRYCGKNWMSAEYINWIFLAPVSFFLMHWQTGRLVLWPMC